jgi:peptide/nickel transport system substrate-binding protein
MARQIEVDGNREREHMMTAKGDDRMHFARRLAGAGLVAALALAHPAAAAETPKRGGILTYVIPADAPPSFDGHREETYATIHSVAPFYSLLIHADPMDPSAGGPLVCDLCTEMPKPTDGGKTFTFKIRDGVKFHNGDKLTAEDIATSWNYIVFPPEGVVSVRQSNFVMVDKIGAPDISTVVFRLKFATDAFLPAVADPFAFIYQKAQLEKDPHWYEKNINGSGPFKFAEYETGQSISGVRNPDYYHPGVPYLDGFKGIYADKQVTRVEAIRSDRAAIEFRGLPPSVRDELVKNLGDQITVQTSDWNCGGVITPNHKKKPFDDPRVRRALTLAIDRWGTAPELAKIAIVHTVGGVTFPGSPLAASKEELQKLAGYWPDIEKSRAEARRLLKEAGQENLSFELLNRSTDQPYKYYGIWVVDQWSKIGVKVTQRVLPTGPWFQAMRDGNFDVTTEGNCQNVVNPLADVGKYLPHTVSPSNYGYFEDEQEIAIYNQLLRELDKQKQHDLLRQFEKRVLDDQAHAIFLLWWERVVPHRSYVKGWKIGPSHYVNQDLATIWLDK